ncbi:hypothetical protein KFV05_02455 [Macrococcoides canis]|uniref:DUF6339 family protein n=1 Tax=Macrococcoides canis TaxID=1855823 RepID=UPI0020B65ABE|nr:DUF6339 family protein [Macrococcus canis]UTH02870.1 hypothetical protein KFV05_02455 [Macrococcus canis]
MKQVIKYATNETVDEFKANFDKYIQYFIDKDEEKLKEIFNEETILEGNMMFDYEPLITDGIYKDTDGKNVEIIHKSLRELTPVQASQEKFWLGMAMTYYKDYLYYRLADEIKGNNRTRLKSALTTLGLGKKRSLIVNVLPRLWWVGELTYDETREDPYELTKMFCRSDFSGKATLFSSSNLTSNKEIRLGVLSALYELDKEIEGGVIRKHYVEALKYLNLIAGVSLLDLKNREEIRQITLEHLKNH